jgi:hypothetical protein
MSENKTPKSIRAARWTAGTVIGGGLLASVAGNVQSILLDTPEGQTPSVGAIISAVWWPALLFAMIHLALTIPWGDGAWRWGRWIGPGVIGGLAFYISFFHLAHVLSYFGYDVVSRYAGPLTVDVAMFVATIAWHRVSVAKELATQEVATLASAPAVATGQPEVATEELATEPAEVATLASLREPSLAEDWADLDTSWDEELATMTAAAQTAPEPTQPAEEPAPAPAEAPAVALTTVPAEAAKRIQEILDETPKATGVAIAQALMAAGLASSEKTGRRYAAAVKNNTARVA